MALRSIFFLFLLSQILENANGDKNLFRSDIQDQSFNLYLNIVYNFLPEVTQIKKLIIIRLMADYLLNSNSENSRETN